MFLRIISNVSVVQGTTFVLQKQTEPRQKLLTAISSGKGVKDVRVLIFLCKLNWDISIVTIFHILNSNRL